MTLAIVLSVAVVVAAAASLVVNTGQRGTRAGARPLDTEEAERWLVSHAPSALRRPLQSIDRRVAGGVATVAVALVLFVLAVIVGATLNNIDEREGFARWDDAAARFGRDRATDASTAMLRAVTHLGDTGWLLVVMAIVAVVAYSTRRRIEEALYLAIVIGGVSILNNSIKWVVHRERPTLSQLTSHAGSSFPSGHSAAAAASWAAVALVLTRRRSRPVRAVAATAVATVAVTVAASRVLLGVHWLTDVIVGLCVGWAWFVVVTIMFGGRLLRFGEPADRISGTAPAARPVDILAGAGSERRHTLESNIDR